MKRNQKRAIKIKEMEFRAEETNGAGHRIGKFSGYLAVYGNRDSYDSMLMKGSFAKSCAEHESFPLLADHDATKVIGKFSAKEDDHGLRIDAEVLLDIEVAQEKWIALKAKAIDGLSVGFSCIREEWDSVLKLLKILEARLWEGSIVTFPANDLATVDQMRAMEPSVREALEPLVEIANEVTENVKMIARAVEGEPRAKERALDLLDRAQESIEALRTKLDAAAEETTTEEPAAGHPSEQEQQAEISATLARMSGIFPTAA